MTPYRLTRTQTVSASINEVFRYFATPLVLDATTPESLQIRLLNSGPIETHEGAVFDYLMRLRGLSLRWTSIITRFNPPYDFSYVQLRGPFRFWEHHHRYRKVTGGVAMEDEVRYLLPLGKIGEIVHAVFVRRELEHIFDSRAEIIARYFATDTSSEVDGSVGDTASGARMISITGGDSSP